MTSFTKRNIPNVPISLLREIRIFFKFSCNFHPKISCCKRYWKLLLSLESSSPRIVHDLPLGTEWSRKNGCKLGGGTFTCMHASLSWSLRSVAWTWFANSRLAFVEESNGLARGKIAAPGKNGTKVEGERERERVGHGLVDGARAAKYLSRGVYTLRLRLFWDARRRQV